MSVMEGVTVHSVPVTGKNPCKITFGDGFLLGCGTFCHGLCSKCKVLSEQ